MPLAAQVSQSGRPHAVEASTATSSGCWLQLTGRCSDARRSLSEHQPPVGGLDHLRIGPVVDLKGLVVMAFPGQRTSQQCRLPVTPP
jgi:hypothetical protein